MRDREGIQGGCVGWKGCGGVWGRAGRVHVCVREYMECDMGWVHGDVREMLRIQGDSVWVKKDTQ